MANNDTQPSRRKRKLGTAGVDPQGDDGEADNGTGNTQKRPRRGRSRRGDDDVSNANSNGGQDHEHKRQGSRSGSETGHRGSSGQIFQPAGHGGASKRVSPETAPLRTAGIGPSTPNGIGTPNLRRLAQDRTKSDNNRHRESCDVSYLRARADDEPKAKSGASCVCNRKNNLKSPTGADNSNLNYYNAFERERAKLRLLLFFTAVFTGLFYFTAYAIIYTLNSNHNLAIQKLDARGAMTAQKQSDAIKSEVNNHKQTRLVLETVNVRLEESQKMMEQLREEKEHARLTHNAQIEEYKSIFQQHGEELRDMLERIDFLRGDKEDSHSTMDMAWLRMDELMEENSELSNDLKRARSRVQLLDKELIHTVENLSHQLKAANEKDELMKKSYHDLNERATALAGNFDLLQHNHNEIAEIFLAPILTYVQKLQRTSQQQHSIILSLTSLVHSLQSSLELSRENIERQTIESMHAVDAVAVAMNEFSLVKTQAYEMDRERYMQHMELKLERLEEEAMGAVQAVATAAGKLEYERKLEEEGRWQSYVEEAEMILDGIRDNIEGENVLGNIGNLERIGETSVLGAAITRRIEEGITSLRSYIHPHNYLKGKDQVSIKSSEEQSLHD
ncbi:hypothetical protein ACHAWF_007513 [Thalassiosira exigua]